MLDETIVDSCLTVDSAFEDLVMPKERKAEQRIFAAVVITAGSRGNTFEREQSPQKPLFCAAILFSIQTIVFGSETGYHFASFPFAVI